MAQALRALALHAQATRRIALQCFADQVVDFSSVDTPFAIDASKAFVASFANIRWQVGAAAAAGALPCTAAAAGPATPPS